MTPRGRGRKRGLTPEDRAIWERVIQSVTRLGPEAGPRKTEPLEPPSGEAARTPPAPAARHDEPELERPRPIRRARSETTLRPAPRMPEPVGRPEPGLDKRTAERLRRGARAPDSRIDLHGMTAERAHAALDRFIGQALARGDRCVLVITGKGGGKGGGKGARRKAGEDAPFMAGDDGVLRQAAPDWLRSGPHRGALVGIYAAHPRHGGAGAFYVYLKRRR